MTTAYLDGLVQATVGDITAQDVDAIVNAANPSLLGGGGVDGAIHRAGGPEILEQCREIRRTLFPSGLPTGEAVMTTGGLLLARHVIHTAGPVYGSHGGTEPLLLASCYRRSIELAQQKELSSIAFPAISTGVFGYPREEAAKVASQAIKAAVARPLTIREVRLVFFSESDLSIFIARQEFDAL